MKNHKLQIAGLLAGTFFLFTSPAGAQDRYRTEVFGSIGVAPYDNGGLFGPGSSGHAANLGGGIGFRPFVPEHKFLRGIGFEFEANGLRLPGSGGSQTWTTYTGNVLYHFSLRRVEPYVLLGAGGSHRGGRTAAAVDLGVGLKIFLNEHISLRPEVRAFLTSLGFFDGYTRGSAAISYHW